MNRILFIFTILLLAISCSPTCKAYPTFESFKHNTIIQDPQTKIDYYIESDRRHVAAIGPEGSVLWYSEIIPANWAGKMFILKISFVKTDSSSTHEKLIDVLVWRGGQGGGRIDTKTGVYTDSGQML
jgi:hypothetical protein